VREEEEVREIAAALDASPSETTVQRIAISLSCYRSHENSFAFANNGSCMKRGGAGVFPWVKEKLRRAGCLPACGGASEQSNRLTVDLHFYPWDVERYGEYVEDSIDEQTKRRLAAQRSPLDRLLDAEPIDFVAYLVAAKTGKKRKKKGKNES
jgi:hypothetical protein